jgi:hypothetical protein
MLEAREKELRIKVAAWLPAEREDGWTFGQMQAQFCADRPELSIVLGRMKREGRLRCWRSPMWKHRNLWSRIIVELRGGSHAH